MFVVDVSGLFASQRKQLAGGFREIRIPRVSATPTHE
jgi:hypothetical protein